MELPKFGSLTSAIVDPITEIRTIKRMGFDYVELGFEEPNATPRLLVKRRSQIIRLISDNKPYPIGHTAYWVHFGSSHEKARKGWVEEAKDMTNVASLLRLPLLNFHFYEGYGQIWSHRPSRKKFTRIFTDSMRELSTFAKRKKVTLMLENVPSSRGFSIKEFEYVVRNTPDLMVHLDIPHAFIEGGMKRVREYIRTFDKKIVHIHWHDNNGERDEHLPIGKGIVDHEKAVHELKKIGYDKTITLEVFPRNQNILKSKKRLENLWIDI